MESLAVTYRPHSFDDVVEQGSTVTILENQLNTGTQKHCYLFCGPAGCGKTTLARIFANELNEGQGTTIELDAASHNGVDDVRTITDQAQTRPLDGKYKCFVIDECHSLSNAAWQAFLKCIEEPPAHAIFLFCTTDPQKIPKTIISRVQRYQIQKISEEGIVKRLYTILSEEWGQDAAYYLKDNSVIPFIARLANGGMRDAITMLDQSLSFSDELTVENVCKALNLSDYNTLMDLADSLLNKESKDAIKIIEDVHAAGFDLKQFVKQFVEFLLDVCKYNLTENISYTQLPDTDEMITFLNNATQNPDEFLDLLDLVLQIDRDIKYSPNPKVYIEALFMTGGR